MDRKKEAEGKKGRRRTVEKGGGGRGEGGIKQTPFIRQPTCIQAFLSVPGVTWHLNLTPSATRFVEDAARLLL